MQCVRVLRVKACEKSEAGRLLLTQTCTRNLVILLIWSPSCRILLYDRKEGAGGGGVCALRSGRPPVVVLGAVVPHRGDMSGRVRGGALVRVRLVEQVSLPTTTNPKPDQTNRPESAKSNHLEPRNDAPQVRVESNRAVSHPLTPYPDHGSLALEGGGQHLPVPQPVADGVLGVKPQACLGAVQGRGSGLQSMVVQNDANAVQGGGGHHPLHHLDYTQILLKEKGGEGICWVGYPNVSGSTTLIFGPPPPQRESDRRLWLSPPVRGGVESRWQSLQAFCRC